MCNGSQVRATARHGPRGACGARCALVGGRSAPPRRCHAGRGTRRRRAKGAGCLPPWPDGAQGRTARHGGQGGGRRRRVSMGRRMGGAQERGLGALQRKPRILHLLARHLHLCRVARRACQREVRRCACRANPNRARAWTRRDRSELLARRPKAVELRLGPRFQGVRRRILCHGRRGGVRAAAAEHARSDGGKSGTTAQMFRSGDQMINENPMFRSYQTGSTQRNAPLHKN